MERRSLMEGLKSPVLDPGLEKSFVYGSAAPASGPSRSDLDPAPKVPASTPEESSAVPRLLISARVRSDLAATLKKVSLERQLNHLSPSTLQAILDEAIEAWLRTQGIKP